MIWVYNCQIHSLHHFVCTGKTLAILIALGKRTVLKKKLIFDYFAKFTEICVH